MAEISLETISINYHPTMKKFSKDFRRNSVMIYFLDKYRGNFVSKTTMGKIVILDVGRMMVRVDRG